MDRISQSLLDAFVVDNSLGTLPEDTAFEHFCGSLVTASHFSELFSSDDITVGGGGDCGIDCITIIVNGCLVTDPDEVEDLVEGMSLCIPDSENLARRFDRLMGPADAFLYDFYFTKNPYHRYVGTWEILSERMFADPLRLRELFISCSHLLLDCPDEQCDAIRRHWGNNVFWDGWGEKLDSLIRGNLLWPGAQTSMA